MTDAEPLDPENGPRADAYRDGYFQALDDVLDATRELVADVDRGVFTLDEIVERLEGCEPWPVVPDEYDDDEPHVALCQDCGEDTLNTLDDDWYMVRDEVWEAAGMPTIATEVGVYLHRRCLEKRLGRKLTVDDYTDALVNGRLLARERERMARAAS